MIVRHVYLEDYDNSYPMSHGSGSHHAVSSDEPGQVFGKPGARIRVRLKRFPVGFQIPPAPPRCQIVQVGVKFPGVPVANKVVR